MTEKALKQLSILEDHVILHPGLNCLDVGGGTGELARWVAEQAARVVVADSSEEMIRALNRSIAENGIENMVPLRIDISAESPEGGPFGLVYAFMSFHHIPDTAGALAQIGKVQKTGGSLLIVDLVAEDGTFHSHISGYNGHNGFDRKALRALVEQTGYHVLSCDPVMSQEKGGRLYPVFALLAEKI